MNIEVLSKPYVIMSDDTGERNYFGWPSIIRLKDGKIAAACSGYRFEHICPFGKAVISFSNDEGKTFSTPVPVIDTVLDDRDAGLCVFGESGLMVTSFNNTVDFQRHNCCEEKQKECFEYLDTVSAEDEKNALGAEFSVSTDNGKTFGKVFRSPVTSPHGPVELNNGRILWAGNRFFSDGTHGDVEVYEIGIDGSSIYSGKINNPYAEIKLCEPYLFQVDENKLICHLRGEDGKGNYFTIFQSESFDSGKSWSEPYMILHETGGAPAHIIRHSSGVLISVYGRRKLPYGIRAMISTDNGESWETDFSVYEQNMSDDIGYPATVETSDGNLLTVFYAHEKETDPAKIFAVKWKINL